MPPDAVKVLLQFRLTRQLFMEVVVIISSVLTEMERGWVSDSDSASVTLTVKFAVPVLVGEPEMIPAELKVRFVGNDPADTFHARVPVPPVACNVWL